MNKLVKNTFKGATTKGFHSSILAALLLVVIGCCIVFGWPDPKYWDQSTEAILCGWGCIVIGVGYIFIKIKSKKKGDPANE